MWTPDPQESILPETGRTMSRLKRLIHEIHRRSLWQVLGIYLVGAWVAFLERRSGVRGSARTICRFP